MARASYQGLNEGGNLLVRSDYDTLTTAKAICEESGVHYKFIHGIDGIDEQGTTTVPHILIVTKEGCARIR
ncbi:MAG: hypothetical protein NZM26_01345 [Patescibacteria group bacterium]|nr:hypothetical protein [Patescibacteria group bacterium]